MSLGVALRSWGSHSGPGDLRVQDQMSSFTGVEDMLLKNLAQHNHKGLCLLQGPQELESHHLVQGTGDPSPTTTTPPHHHPGSHSPILGSRYKVQSLGCRVPTPTLLGLSAYMLPAGFDLAGSFRALLTLSSVQEGKPQECGTAAPQLPSQPGHFFLVFSKLSFQHNHGT